MIATEIMVNLEESETPLTERERDRENSRQAHVAAFREAKFGKRGKWLGGQPLEHPVADFALLQGSIQISGSQFQIHCSDHL